MQNLAELTKRLIDSRAEFVLVGGFAALAHGVMRSTRDVDICCRFSTENLMRIQAAFADLHPTHQLRTDLPLNLTPEQCAGLKNLYLKTDLGVVDCLGEILGVGDFEEVLKRSVELELPVGKCRVMDLDSLIAAKQAMGRDRDQLTVRDLEEIKRRVRRNG